MTTSGATAGAAARQQHAAESLFTRYRDQIYRFCLSRLRSREEAEDALQNVFLRVHLALQRGVVPEYEAAWLYKIAHNVCLSKHESTARRARLETPVAMDDEEFPVAAREVSHEELAGLSDALAAMPPRLRTAILLREWQGLSYAEIAEAMGVSVSAVETLIFRARKHLAQALEQGTPRRSLAMRVLDVLTLRMLLRRLRGLFGGIAPAKLAAGAALVAASGAGLGAAVALTPPSTAKIPAGVTIHLPAAITARTPATPSHTHARAAHVARHSAPQALHVASPTAFPAAPSVNRIAVPPKPAPTTTASPAVTPAAQAPSPSASASPVPAVTAPIASVPAATVPVVSVPAMTTPTVSTPTVAAPTVAAPTVSVPAVSATLPAVGTVTLGG